MGKQNRKHDPRGIADSLRPHFGSILSTHGVAYDSHHMQTGVDVPGLVGYAPVAKSFFEMDGIGANILQTDMLEGVQILTQEQTFKSAAARSAASHLMDVDRWASLHIAHKLRVILSHIRYEKSRWEKLQARQDAKPVATADHPQALIDLYKLIRADPKSSASPPVTSPTAQSKSAANPFVYFRTDSEEEDDPQNDCDTSVVASYYKASSNKAVQLLSSGEEREAVRYERGDSGFAKAQFEDGKHLVLDVPNAFVDEQGALQATRCMSHASSGAMKRRPAAATKRPAGCSEPVAGSGSRCARNLFL